MKGILFGILSAVAVIYAFSVRDIVHAVIVDPDGNPYAPGDTIKIPKPGDPDYNEVTDDPDYEDDGEIYPDCEPTDYPDPSKPENCPPMDPNNPPTLPPIEPPPYTPPQLPPPNLPPFIPPLPPFTPPNFPPPPPPPPNTPPPKNTPPKNDPNDWKDRTKGGKQNARGSTGSDRGGSGGNIPGGGGVGGGANTGNSTGAEGPKGENGESMDGNDGNNRNRNLSRKSRGSSSSRNRNTGANRGGASGSGASGKVGKMNSDGVTGAAKTVLDAAIGSIGTTNTNLKSLGYGNVGCGYAASKMLQKAGYDFPNQPYTPDFKKQMDGMTTGPNPQFKLIPGGLGAAQPGDVVVTPTVTGKGGGTGHVGIQAKDGRIISNSSKAKNVSAHHTKASWKSQIESRGKGLPTYIYRPL